MNKKDTPQQLNQDRGEHTHEEDRDRRTNKTSAPKTEVKNSNAAGQGTLGRHDERAEEEDGNDRVY